MKKGILAMKRFLHGIYRATSLGSYLQSPLLLILRLYFGIQFFVAGFGKLQDINHFIGELNSLHIPFALGNAYLVAFVETIGGFCLAIGFLSRLFAIPLIINMSVAYSTAHVAAVYTIFAKPDLFIAQAPFNFLLTSLIVLAFGPGKFSIDYALMRDHYKINQIP